MLDFYPTVVCCSCFLALVYLVGRWRTRHANPHRLPFPPGPRPLPIIGNLHQQPKGHDWLKYTEWANEYGPIVHFRLFGQHVVLLNTSKACFDLLEKRSDRFGDRPRSFIMAGELMGWSNGLTLQPLGPRHRRYRKLVSGTLNPTAARKQWPLQEAAAQTFLGRLAKHPDQLADHIRTSISEAIVMMVFGRECSKDKFPYPEMAEKDSENFLKAAAPYVYVVDSLPILRHLPEWFPGAGFKKQASIWNKGLQELVHFPYRAVKADVDNGTARSSYVASQLDTDKPLSTRDEEDIMWTAASMYTGAVDTTIATLTTFMVAMCLFPHIQSKAQAELDSVIGLDRLPTIADREKLPYLNACLKELMRWCPIAPLGMTHRVTQAEYYEGYYIPEGQLIPDLVPKYFADWGPGASVISNIWAISRDPIAYPLPDEFRPERFLQSENSAIPDEVSVFGFGRRICPGMHLAQASVFIYAARTLATFNILRARDAEGNEIQPKLEWVSGLITHPKPVKCTISIRSDHAAQLIGEM